MTASTTLTRQLRAILQLTEAEVQTTRMRTAQARSDEVRRELERRAGQAEQRARTVSARLRALGGVPDAVTPVIGRLTAVVKGAVEQTEPFDEALLHDLVLQQQLVARARYLRVLAEAADERSVRELAERLEEAHTEAAERIHTTLAEEALGGPATLRATALQRTAGTVTRAFALPVRFTWEGVNRAVNGAQGLTTMAFDAATSATNQVLRLGGAAREVAGSGRDASLRSAERVAQREGAAGTARAVHDTRRGLGSLEPSELPIRDFDGLNQQDAIRRIKDLGEAEEVRVVLRYEQAHKDRAGVTTAAQGRINALAKELVEQ
ncbi:hypothetical protein GCM10023321_22160 [Pseudonocardia eucalypti]|uniref:Ferritin-like domain-containing protein n=1 Tax=Pseudonocardia eucalypti TaxID=648755 RepID=A0ABP9Q274_9PSEU|nr:hypothetical protein [Pseudonocardia eucalypti]